MLELVQCPLRDQSQSPIVTPSEHRSEAPRRRHERMPCDMEHHPATVGRFSLNTSQSTMLPRQFVHWLSKVLLDVTVIFVCISSFDALRNSFLVHAEHRVINYRANPMLSAVRPACGGSSNACPEHSHCIQSLKKCQCKPDYVQVGTFVNKSYISQGGMICLPIARLDDRCASDHQCLVEYSECKPLISQSTGGGNQTNHFCKCRHGHELKEHDSMDIFLNGKSYRFRPICSWEKPTNATLINTIILISLLVIIILIGTFVALVRYQRWRNQPFPGTITSIAASQGMNSHMMGNNHLMTGSPPPMGSVEAEFENDFIQVFPMHHLEPMPDKNAHAFVIR